MGFTSFDTLYHITLSAVIIGRCEVTNGEYIGIHATSIEYQLPSMELWYGHVRAGYRTISIQVSNDSVWSAESARSHITYDSLMRFTSNSHCGDVPFLCKLYLFACFQFNSLTKSALAIQTNWSSDCWLAAHLKVFNSWLNDWRTQHLSTFIFVADQSAN